MPGGDDSAWFGRDSEIKVTAAVGIAAKACGTGCRGGSPGAGSGKLIVMNTEDALRLHISGKGRTTVRSFAAHVLTVGRNDWLCIQAVTKAPECLELWPFDSQRFS